MNTEEVAKKVVELTRKQAWYEALDTLYDDNVVSVEASGMGGGSPETRGKQGVRGKIDWWVNGMEVHSFDVHGPFVAHDRFVVQFDPSNVADLFGSGRSPHSNPRNPATSVFQRNTSRTRTPAAVVRIVIGMPK